MKEFGVSQAELQARMAMLSEIAGGSLLALGLFTRPACGKDQEGDLLVKVFEPAGQLAGRGDPDAKLPEAAQEEQRVAEADEGGQQPLSLGHVLHLQAHEV
jgi:hypothetical protein